MNDVLSKSISSVLGGLIVGALALFFGAFDKQLSDSQVEDVALQIINVESTRNVLLTRLSEDGRFVGPPGPQGPDGEPGPGWEPHYQDFEIQGSRENPQSIDLALGPHRYCALAEARARHETQACGCRVTRDAGEWQLSLILDETADGTCNCRAGCFD